MKKNVNIPKVAMLVMHTAYSAGFFYILQRWAFLSLDLNGWVLSFLLALAFFVVWTPVLGAVFMASMVYWVMGAPIGWALLCLAPMVAYLTMGILFSDRLMAKSRRSANKERFNT